jgi:hypothetical protein
MAGKKSLDGIYGITKLMELGGEENKIEKVGDRLTLVV